MTKIEKYTELFVIKRVFIAILIIIILKVSVGNVVDFFLPSLKFHEEAYEITKRILFVLGAMLISIAMVRNFMYALGSPEDELMYKAAELNDAEDIEKELKKSIDKLEASLLEVTHNDKLMGVDSIEEKEEIKKEITITKNALKEAQKKIEDII